MKKRKEFYGEFGDIDEIGPDSPEAQNAIPEFLSRVKKACDEEEEEE